MPKELPISPTAYKKIPTLLSCLGASNAGMHPFAVDSNDCSDNGTMRLFRCLALLLLLFSLPVALSAQALLNCKVQPTNLKQMRLCWRPLLVFSPTDHDPRLRQQEAMLDADADDMMDRFVLFTPIVPTIKNLPTPLDAPWTQLSLTEMNSIRSRFHVPEGQFTVLLLDELGQVRLRSQSPIATSLLNQRIDTWPRRKREEARRGAN